MNLLSGNLTAVDPLVSALGTLNKSISLFAAFTLIGVLLALSFLLLEREGKLRSFRADETAADDGDIDRKRCRRAHAAAINASISAASLGTPSVSTS